MRGAVVPKSERSSGGRVGWLWYSSSLWAGALRSFLIPLSLLYGLVVLLRRSLYRWGVLRAKSLGVPVVSVGNVVVGGTGKSVVVGLLAGRVVAAGQRAAILMRGYRSGLSAGGWQVLKNGRVVAGEMARPSDEAAMHSAHHPQVPVVCGVDRFAAWSAFRSSPHWTHPELVILDDGMQHLQIRRDLEVLAADVTRPLGSGHLLPLGDLREPRAALRSTQLAFAIANDAPKVDLAADLGRILESHACRAEILHLVAKTGSPQSITGGESWTLDHNASPLIVVGIAHPKRFLDGLRLVGVRTDFVLTVEDHGEISPDLLNQQVKGRSSVVTTAKDYWRSPTLFSNLKIPVFIAPLEAELSVEDRKTLESKLAELQKPS